jgi:dTDP-4-dehydrorhamnose 3,5-epimerase
LSQNNANMLAIPEGCAHGFQVLDANSELLYLHTNFYTQDAEGGLPYNDPRLDFRWPLPVVDLSTRDQNYPLINRDYIGLVT